MIDFLQELSKYIEELKLLEMWLDTGKGAKYKDEKETILEIKIVAEKIRLLCGGYL